MTTNNVSGASRRIVPPGTVVPLWTSINAPREIPKKIRFAFFGTSHIARFALEELYAAGFTPSLIVTAPDAPVGRKQVITPSAVSDWADTHYIPTLKPEKITSEFIEKLKERDTWDVFVVIDYGYILPRTLLDVPAHGTLNIHPSLLPRLRGPSPIRSAILTDEHNTGVTVMLLDEKMDHGPIIAQEKVTVTPWPPRITTFEETLARTGGALLARTLRGWIAGTIEAKEQNHADATFCTMLTKEDGLLNLNDDPYTNFLKIRALEGWPGTYTFFERSGAKIRVKIIDATFTNNQLTITRVVPEGKNEMSYEEFVRSGAQMC